MALPLSKERPVSRALRTIAHQANDMAKAGRQHLLSTHILLTFYTVYNPAADVLRKFGVRLEHLSHLSRTNQQEDANTIEMLFERANQISTQCHQQTTSALHMLAAMAQSPQSLAHRSLLNLGVDTQRLFDVAMNKAIEQQGHTPIPTRPSTDEHRAPTRRQISSHLLGQGLAEVSSTAHDDAQNLSLRQRNRNKLLERSSPVHPALRDSWLRTTPAGGVPALSRQPGAQQHNASATPPPPPMHPPMQTVDAIPTSGLTIDALRPQVGQMMSMAVSPVAQTPNTHSPLAQTPAEPPQQVPAQRKSLKDRFAERKAEIRRRRQQRVNTPKPPTKTPPKVVKSEQPAQEDEHIFVLPSTRKTPTMHPPRHADDAIKAKEPADLNKDRNKDHDNKNEQHKTPEPPQARQEMEPPQDHGLITEEDSKSQAMQDARNATRSLASRLFAKKAQKEADEETTRPVEPAKPTTKEHKKQATPRRPDPALAAHYRLDPEMFPLLSKFGRNLTEEAALARIDPVVGRDDEITRVIDILGKRRGNNPLLVGEPGVGKTALVEGLAQRFCQLAHRNNRLGKRTIIELEIGRLLSGTHLRGAFSERLIAIKDEVRQADGNVIIFLDEIHLWMNAGQSGDGADAAGELKTALARGQFPCIGATTADEYTRFVETDMAFQRRFQIVQVEEPSIETAMIIAQGVRLQYESHHGITLDDSALKAAVHMSHRYIQDRQLPDKALNVIDMASSRASRHNKRSINENDIAHVVAEMCGLPVDRLTQSDGERFLNIEKRLANVVVGHDDVIHTIAEVLRRNYAGFRSHRPIGTMLFLGPTGVGKTEMVKALADFLFHDREAIVRLDMSEFMEAHAVSRFIGAPPGYVGYEQGGQLTEAVRRSPYQVVLLDEIEKAHPDILNILLQLFDEGRLTDGRGRVVDFSNTLIIMTSNLGSHVFEEDCHEDSRQRIGFGKSNVFGLSSARTERLREKVRTSASQHFTPELWNRIEERLVFMPLQRDEVARIAELQLSSSNKRLRQDSNIGIDYDPCVIDLLIEHGGYNPQFGARPMRQTIQRLIESNIARLILANKVSKGDTIHITVRRGELHFQRLK